jgi:hypothetical protein
MSSVTPTKRILAAPEPLVAIARAGLCLDAASAKDHAIGALRCDSESGRRFAESSSIAIETGAQGIDLKSVGQQWRQESQVETIVAFIPQGALVRLHPAA